MKEYDVDMLNAMLFLLKAYSSPDSIGSREDRVGIAKAHLARLKPISDMIKDEEVETSLSDDDILLDRVRSTDKWITTNIHDSNDLHITRLLEGEGNWKVNLFRIYSSNKYIDLDFVEVLSQLPKLLGTAIKAVEDDNISDLRKLLKQLKLY